MAIPSIYGLALCDGIGGFELGLKLALPRYRTVCRVELEAYAATVLVERMEEQTLDRCPLWDDLKSFDGAAWSGAVDIITAGFPCQPWSIAGKRKGCADKRWIWEDIDRIIGNVTPDCVFLENVPHISKGGLAVILSTLADRGYDAEWDLFSAADCGAPHIRARMFILAYRNRVRQTGWWQAWRRGFEPEDESSPVDHKTLAEMWPPPPGDLPKWMEVATRQPEALPALLRVVDGISNPVVTSALEYRQDRIRCLGNAVVPIVVAHAFTTLNNRFMEEVNDES